jgi:hypothetical protein
MNDPISPAGANVPEYLQRAKTRVRIITPSGIIEGDHSHAPGVRLSDSLRNASSAERYMLLTNVAMRSLDGANLGPALGADDAPFVLISTGHMSMVIPLEDA